MRRVEVILGVSTEVIFLQVVGHERSPHGGKPEVVPRYDIPRPTALPGGLSPDIPFP